MIEQYHGSKSIEAIILVGGKGSRMGTLTETTQKCLLPVDEKPVLYHIIDRVLDAFGSVDLKMGVCYKTEQVQEAMKQYMSGNVSVSYIPHAEGSESYGAYMSMRDQIKAEPFLCLPGDVILPTDFYTSAMKVYEEEKYPVVTGLSPHMDEVTTHPTVRVMDHEVTTLTYPAPPIVARDEYRDTTVYVADKRFFQTLIHFPSTNKDVSSSFNQARAVGAFRMGGLVFTKPWIHLADQSDLQKSARRLAI